MALENPAAVTRADVESALAPTGGAVNPNPGIGSNVVPTSGEGGNVYLGVGALESITTGQLNVGVGNLAGSSIATGNDNVCVGPVAGGELTEGTANVMVGLQAGVGVTTGNFNVCVGYLAGRKLTASAANQLRIGKGDTGEAERAMLIAGDMEALTVGFLGAAPVAMATHPTTLAEVITILKNLGFCE